MAPPDGTVGSDRETVALFTGEAVHAYLGHLSDETIEAMLNELSIELGAVAAVRNRLDLDAARLMIVPAAIGALACQRMPSHLGDARQAKLAINEGEQC